MRTAFAPGTIIKYYRACESIHTSPQYSVRSGFALPNYFWVHVQYDEFGDDIYASSDIQFAASDPKYAPQYSQPPGVSALLCGFSKLPQWWRPLDSEIWTIAVVSLLHIVSHPCLTQLNPRFGP